MAAPKFTTSGSIDQLLRLASESPPPDVANIATTPRAGSELTGRMTADESWPEPGWPSDLGVRSERRSPMWIPMEPPTP